MEFTIPELRTIWEILSRYIDEDDYLRHEGEYDAGEHRLHANATAICQRLHEELSE